MPANLPPAYHEAEQAYRRAKLPADKIEAIEKMLAVMPKHKGTDHLKAELRARIARLTQEAQHQGGGAARVQLYSVQKEGAGQVSLVGLANVGKSALLAALTGTTPRVADYPFTTQLPQPAMMPVGNVQVQLVDLPPIIPDATPGWQRALVRQADVLLLVVDLSQDPLAEWETLQTELAKMRVVPVAPSAEPDGAEESPPKKTLLAATKYDAPAAAEGLELL